MFDLSVPSSEIAYQSGYNDPHYFSAAFKKVQGMSPKEYGEYLMRTGKDKYNKRKRKHIAKGIA